MTNTHPSSGADKAAAPARDPQTEDTQRKRTRNRRLLLIGTIVLAGTLAYGAWWWTNARWSEETDDAYVQGNAVAITPQVDGTVVSIAADTTQLVRQGQPVVQLDTTDADLALRQSEANLAQSVRQVRQLFHQVTENRQLVAEKRQALDQARLDDQRNKELMAHQGASIEQVQHGHTDAVKAQAELRQAESQLSASLAAVDNATPETHPQVLQAEAALRNAYVARQRTTIVAPVTGYVAQRSVQIGQRVHDGTQLLSIVPVEQMWVDANFKETQLHDVRIGQAVMMHADLYGGSVDFPGKVVGIGLGTGNAFSLLPAQNATGNWIKVVQRVPVRVQPDLDALKQHPLRIGLSMDVSISLRDGSGAMLAQQPATSSMYDTRVYDHAERGAEALIKRILAANLGTDTSMGVDDAAAVTAASSH
ncbi:efflux RND transporter periplasmic adaptor subunit [Dyella sp. C9]|uniref:efflux RND transporter periplasmic adaptor subunit n=1 Tax=Dyella sp. C9 TaxID=2202154 RepID=UPI000DEEC597|nr:efflux RND transporter periplasmic adaptor subunit [Dyella sp. C9]